MVTKQQVWGRVSSTRLRQCGLPSEFLFQMLKLERTWLRNRPGIKEVRKFILQHWSLWEMFEQGNRDRGLSPGEATKHVQVPTGCAVLPGYPCCTQGGINWDFPLLKPQPSFWFNHNWKTAKLPRVKKPSGDKGRGRLGYIKGDTPLHACTQAHTCASCLRKLQLWKKKQKLKS